MPASNIKNISGFMLSLVLFLIPFKGSCQELDIVTPNTNQSFKLPDPATFTTPAQAKTRLNIATISNRCLHRRLPEGDGKSTKLLTLQPL